MNAINSKRKYAVAYIEQSQPISFFITMNEILKEYSDPQESTNAIQDNFDAIADLKEGERLLMSFNRDVKDSSGYIQRTN